MNTESEQGIEQAASRNIVYWPDGYFIAEDDALEQGEILDSVEAFGSLPHKVLLVPVAADRDQMQVLVNAELETLN